MALRYNEDDLVQHLANIFAESENKSITINASKIRSPTMDFARDIFYFCLTESGLKLATNSAMLDMMEMTSTTGFINEHVFLIQLTATARHLFDGLAVASLEHMQSQMRFSLNDILHPESKRIKYFLGHFVNYWLFCNNHFERFHGVDAEVEEKASQRVQFVDKIDEYKKKNAEIRKSKYSSAKKEEKLREKIAQDMEKLKKLTEDASALKEEINVVKEELASYKEQESEYEGQGKILERSALRLKTISKQDEIKQELENQLEALKREEEEKQYQLKDYVIKDKNIDQEEEALKENIASFQSTKDLISKEKMSANELRSLRADCDAAHEKLEAIEIQLNAHLRAKETLNNELMLLTSKWDKTKHMKETDLNGYADKLSSVSKSATEDDWVINEIDSKYAFNDKDILNRHFS